MRIFACFALLVVCACGGCRKPSPQSAPAAAANAPSATTPLGSKDNPVRCDMPGGQRAYMERLKCSNGTRPKFTRVGSFGKGPHGNILDGYDVKCGAGEPVRVYMDMYHPGHVEKEAVPGFMIDEH